MSDIVSLISITLLKKLINYEPWLPIGLAHAACGITMTGWGGVTNGFETGSGANKAGLAPNDGANVLEPNIASLVVCAVEPAPNSGSTGVEVLLNAAWELAFAPNVVCDAATENRSPPSGEEWRLPLTLAASWSGRVGDVSVDAEDLTTASVELLDAAGELDAICFNLCCCINADEIAQF